MNKTLNLTSHKSPTVSINLDLAQNEKIVAVRCTHTARTE
jgi:hypothetical protein